MFIYKDHFSHFHAHIIRVSITYSEVKRYLILAHVIFVYTQIQNIFIDKVYLFTKLKQKIEVSKEA